jgi:hypothetical protein
MSKISSDSVFLFRVIIGFLAIICILCTNKPNFCEDKDTAIDAVLWDGMRYRLAVNEWMAYYNESTGTVGEFIASDLNCMKKV